MGFSQGTVIGPLLSHICINEMSNIRIPGKIISFADYKVWFSDDLTLEGSFQSASGGVA